MSLTVVVVVIVVVLLVVGSFLRRAGFERVLDVGPLHNMRGLPAGRAPRR